MDRFLFIAFFVVGLDCLPQGSKCRNSNSPGVCTPVPNCTLAIDSIARQGHHDLKRCGFDHFTEIVCCPNSDLRGIQSTTEQSSEEDSGDKTNARSPFVPIKSKKACENYAKKLPIVLSYHIVGGENADIGEFPHMTALGFYSEADQVYKFDCGGTLISNNYVITAAHCIINSEQNQLKIARMGVVDVPATVERPDPKLDYNVANITVHQEYNWKEKFNDIALVKLEKHVSFTEYIRPACLYTNADDPQRLLVTGWGVVNLGGERSNILQKAILSPVPIHNCNSTYLQRTKRRIIRSQICAKDERSDACQGDSGGPLQIQSNTSILTIVGITSYGIGCGSKYPGIYTRINSYLDWIEEKVWP